jgi:hypothetical protein
MKRTALIAALAALAVGSMSAQERTPRQPDPKMIEAHKELIGSLKDFARTTVLPQLTTWKGQLDGAMSAEDLQKLNGLRSRSAQLKEQGREIARSMRESWRSEDYDQLKSAREQMKGLRDQQRAIFTELKPLAEKYRPTLEAIGQDAKTKVEGWKEEGMSIVEKWMAEHKDELGDMQGHMHGMMKGFGGWMRGMDKEGRRKMIAARFMLWDGSNFLDKMEQNGAPGMEGLDEFGLE